MTTIINNPPQKPSDDSGSGLLTVILLLVIIGIGFLFYTYGIPWLQDMSEQRTVDINGTLPQSE